VAGGSEEPRGTLQYKRPVRGRKVERNTKERVYLKKRRIQLWVPPPLKLDIKRIAKTEKQPLSRMCAGLLRLGVARYFEQADENLVAPLRELMQDAFPEGDPIPPPGNGPGTGATMRKLRRQREFDAAIEEGNQRFEASRRQRANRAGQGQRVG
jgi:hypothetical protein